MARPEQVLIIEPDSELSFRGPFTGKSITSYIKLSNPSPHLVYYKIKTTAPKRYCVRPNSGRLRPKDDAEIAVTLQPIDFDPAERNKHKFMVQTLISDVYADGNNFHDVWKDIDPKQLMDSKLKCVFENPVSNTTTTKSITTATTTKSEANLTNDKNKATEDSVKPSPLDSDDTHEKLMKASLLVNQLRADETILRHQNLILKEEIMALRNVGSESKMASLVYAKGFNSARSNACSRVIVAIAMVIVGYLLGKMI